MTNENLPLKNRKTKVGLSKEEAFILFGKIFDQSSMAFFCCNLAGNIVYCNNAAVKLWGRSPDYENDLWCGALRIYSLEGNVLNPEECPMAVLAINNVKLDPQEVIIELPDGSFKRLLSSPQRLYNDNQELIGVHNILIDITRQREEESNKNILLEIVKSSNDAIVSKDLEGMITSWNQSAEELFGFSEQEILGKSIKNIIPDELLSEEENIIDTIKSGGKIRHRHTIRKRKDGSKFNVSITVSPIRDFSGKIIGASKIARDITSFLKNQEKLKKYSERLEILNTIGKTISEKLNVKDILQKVIDATTQLTGASFGAFFYKTISNSGEELTLYNLSGASKSIFETMAMPRQTELLHHAFYGDGPIRLDDVTADNRYGQNFPHYGMPDGHLPVRSYLSMPVISNSGKSIGGLLFGHPDPGVFKKEHEDLLIGIASQAAIAIDNSELFEEVTALNAKKDEFIALASHELKTPLTSIKGYLQILSRNIHDRELSGMFVEKAIKQAERLTILVKDLLNVSKIEAGKLELEFDIFDLRELVIESIENFAHITRSHKISFKDMQIPALVKADRQRIEQVMLNILSNAVKYSPKADSVQVEIEHKNGRVVVKVKDFGVGLSEINQRKIFDRFYRAEGMANVSGLGLGLYLAKEVIERHGGQITVESELDKGSEFVFSLSAYHPHD
ncbi:PAS domain S-box protein [Pseudopedobacter beijingensis]|uniref:histidine kinase n=1 Tax=Pseudopedobacter beijingensis TaxID=1207056 RepID=A0ABW4IFL5_9SPHI